MLDFSTAVSLFKNDKIRELSATDEGMRFLKLRLKRMWYLLSSNNIKRHEELQTYVH